ncbi:alpha/beta hydrolase-fold protein [Bacillus sp. FSL H8-0547]
MSFKLREIDFFSRCLQREMRFYLLSNQAFEQNESVYVLYVQDGLDYLEIGELEQKLGGLMGKPLLIVLVPPGDSMQRYACYHPNGDTHGEYVTFFLEELLPFVADQVLCGKRAVKQGMLGDSLGGAVSVSIFLRDPKIWTHLLLQSAAFSPVHLEEVNALGKHRNLHVHQLVGLKEDDFVTPISRQRLWILTRNRLMRKAWTEKEAQLSYIEKDEDHVWTFWKDHLEEALLFFANQGG